MSGWGTSNKSLRGLSKYGVMLFSIRQVTSEYVCTVHEAPKDRIQQFSTYNEIDF